MQKVIGLLLLFASVAFLGVACGENDGIKVTKHSSYTETEVGDVLVTLYEDGPTYTAKLSITEYEKNIYWDLDFSEKDIRSISISDFGKDGVIDEFRVGERFGENDLLYFYLSVNVTEDGTVEGLLEVRPVSHRKGLSPNLEMMLSELDTNFTEKNLVANELIWYSINEHQENNGITGSIVWLDIPLSQRAVYLLFEQARFIFAQLQTQNIQLN